MNKKYAQKETAKTLFTVFNIILYIVLFLVTLVFRYPYVNYFFNGYVMISLIYAVFLVIFGKMFEMFELGETRVYELFLSYSLALCVTNVFIYMVCCVVAYSALNIWPMVQLQIVMMFISAFLLLRENRIVRDKFPVPRAIAIFGEPNYEILEKIYKYRDILVTVEKKVDIKDINLDDLDDILNGYDRVITIDVDHNDKKLIFKKCYENRINVYDIPSISDTLIASGTIMHVIDTPIIRINKFGPSFLEGIIKRFIDIVGSLVLIVITSPVMLATAIAIKVYDKGDVFFRQERLTQDGKVFRIYKFRSMIMNAEKNTGAILAREGDNRITPVGRFIRKCRIDELPQLFNILKGDMTFVGPRPERPELFDEIVKEVPEFKYRLTVKAGLTGYAQIYGKYNTTMRDKLLLDIYYIENYSLITDIKLIIMTLKVIFIPESTEGVKE